MSSKYDASSCDMILGIENRAENWKTALCLSPFFGDRSVCLARRLGESQATQSKDVKLELFWNGVRDWCVGKDRDEYGELLIKSYRRLFPNLRKQIQRHRGFFNLRDGNYEATSDVQKEKLVTNLFHTEIDIVLESPGHLYVGEAKCESDFNTKGDRVLVHQLIRQYVMAKVLLDVLECDREVVPFVVVEDCRKHSRHMPTARKLTAQPHQVRFMVNQGWMDLENCLTWDDFAAMTTEVPIAGEPK